MRRIILLLAMVAFALVLVGGVAASKQRQEEASTSSQSSTTSDKESASGDVSIQSTTVKASFASGSGANFLGVKVSDHGNMLSFESPADQEAVFDNNEGYVVCYAAAGIPATSHDTGGVEGGFGPPKLNQPNPGKFPLTVTRKTTDGKVQLKQVWAKPDATEMDVTVTMTLKNISTSTITLVRLVRTGEFDVGATSIDRGARTGDSVWLWDDSSGAVSPPVGLMLTALTFGTPHGTRIETASVWQNSSRTSCASGDETTPTAPGDFAMRVFYDIGNMSAGQSKTVKFKYGRM